MPETWQWIAMGISFVAIALSLYFNWDVNRMCKEVERRYRDRA